MTRLAAVAGAMLVAAAGFAVLHSMAGIDLAATTGTTVQHVTLTATMAAAAIAAVAGWLSLALLERLTSRGRAIWTAIAVTVLLLSLLAGPAAGTTGGAKAGLALLHLAVGAVVIGTLRRSSSR
ncbi:hypothetical protein Rhe02_41550 [Rhizocola hellebori]|uniref:Uncharacterized protein n=2 Tax=Rhizocola hellebori TaxID=1392758 RepID=A0A8J3VHN0_9ACTN|nr:hypothetical protein Rhe02_41550 [Rhizocola hellebori]